MDSFFKTHLKKTAHLAVFFAIIGMEKLEVKDVLREFIKTFFNVC